jgi:uncharacterized protein
MKELSNISIKISPDEYTAYISIQPEENSPLTLIELGPVLKERGVISGIKRDVIPIILEQNKNGLVVDNVLIAEGTLPDEGRAPEIDYKFEFSSKPQMDEKGRIDYREISQILSVKKGVLLAIKKKMVQSVDGLTVTGKKTPTPKHTNIPLRLGKNIINEDKGDTIHIFAEESGVLKFENNSIAVFATLDIAQDVDFNVGNVNFKGNIKIGRDVLPDFVVKAEGNISIFGSAIACKLNATDDIEVRAGIVGKNKGEVICGADLTATFVENVKMKVQNDVTVKNGIIGSDVFCDGILKVEMPRSRIVGSTIRAAKSILAFNIGSRFDTSTCLITGIDPEKEQEYIKIKTYLDGKLNEAKEIEKKYGRSTLENKEFPASIAHKMKEDVIRWDRLKREIQNILKRLKSTEEQIYDYNAIIKVKETLFPRVSIKLGKFKLTTHKEYHNVIVRYSDENDRLMID